MSIHDHYPLNYFLYKFDLIKSETIYEKYFKSQVEYFGETVGDIDMVVKRIPIGKENLKKLKVSPDAFIQAALQLAHFRLHSKFVLTYEAAVTLLFKAGRYLSLTNSKLFALFLLMVHCGGFL